MSKLENRIPPPLVLLFVGVAMWVTARATPRLILPPSVHLAASAAVAALGLAFAALGVAAFRRARTTINPVDIDAASSLVVTGIFKLSRNPMYVGMTTLLLAWALYLRAPWAAIGPPAFALFIRRFQILPEERVMQAKFGAAYDDYRRRVGRWL